MELFVGIVKSHRHAEEILTGFLELGVRGATVVDGRGMGQVIATDIPIFSGFKGLFPVGGGATYVILSAMDSSQIEPASDLVDEICAGLEHPGTGVVFTLPLSTVRGLAKEIR